MVDVAKEMEGAFPQGKAGEVRVEGTALLGASTSYSLALTGEVLRVEKTAEGLEVIRTSISWHLNLWPNGRVQRTDKREFATIGEALEAFREVTKLLGQ